MRDIKFGMIDKDGEFLKGYIDEENQMKFKKLSLWEKFVAFLNPHIPEIDKDIIMELEWSRTNRFTGVTKVVERSPVYREFEKLTNKTVRIYTRNRYRTIEFDVFAYDKTGKLYEIY